jgi:hypothetical protein
LLGYNVVPMQRASGCTGHGSSLLLMVPNGSEWFLIGKAREPLCPLRFVTLKYRMVGGS